MPVAPPDKLPVPVELQSAVPPDAIVRLIQPVQLSAEGETALIYDSGDEFEPNAHLAIVKNGKLMADFGLVQLFTGEVDNFAFSQAAQFAAPDHKSVFIAAFRNLNDGAATLFVLLKEEGGHYIVAWRAQAVQAQFKVLADGEIQLWEAVQGDKCLWCAHRYDVSTLQWANGTLTETSQSQSKHALAPNPFAEKPIAIER